MVPCSLGHYMLPSGECEVCQDGFYQNDGYSDSCQSCEIGHLTGGPGATHKGQCGKLTLLDALYVF